MTTYALRLGGLGNQLFQLAAAIGLDPEGDGRLVRTRPAGHVDVEHLVPGLDCGADEREAEALQRLAPEQRHEQPLRDLAAAFVPMPAWVEQPVLLTGYFQHPDWYSAAVPQLVDRIVASAPAEVVPRSGGAAVVNVRGGDYVRLQRELPLSYYVAAARHLELTDAEVVTGDDDRGTVVAAVLTAAGYPTRPPTTRSTSSAIDDFWAVAAAPVVVMANSTFSWWAVQVGDELYRRAGLPRTVVAPKDWILGHGTELVESRWIAVS